MHRDLTPDTRHSLEAHAHEGAGLAPAAAAHWQGPAPAAAASPASAQAAKPRPDGPPPRRLDTLTRRRFTHGAAPALQRGHMVPRPWLGFGAGLRQALGWSTPPDLAPAPRSSAQAAVAAARAGGGATAAPQASQMPDAPAAAARRRTLLALVLLAAVLASTVLLLTQPLGGSAMLRAAQIGLFSLLFAWVTAGCVTALMGYRVLRHGDHAMLSHAQVAGRAIDPAARTAVVMPICNEHVATVFAGLAATADSVVEAGGAGLVELYVLSDTSEPALRSAERQAWARLSDRLAPSGLKLHYRWRLHRSKRKAGNVADFCRRWGRLHRYMVVLDADSVMSGEAVLGLVRLMEAQPQAGIVQSAPVSCGVDTVHARLQQFAGRVTGRLFGAGMQYWQLGESHYWGHNAIIRIAPFMQHGALAAIPGRGGLAGDILSHDFVEAALMRRAGWQVWLVPDLPGSWEQQPPDLLAELQRDRRWCQGNLQNARLIAEPGLHRVHRAMLATGAMAYLSAPLWLASVTVGVTLWLTGGAPVTPAGDWVSPAVATLWAATLGMLLLPRALGVALVLHEGRQAQFGGSPRLVASALLEAGASALLAPLRMAAHTLFVVVALTGLKLAWTSPPRQALGLAWRHAARPLAPLSVLAGAALLAAAWASPGMALWLAPMLLPLLLALPTVVATGSPLLGQRLRTAGLLLTPEEVAPPRPLRQAWAEAAALAPSTDAQRATQATVLDWPRAHRNPALRLATGQTQRA